MSADVAFVAIAWCALSPPWISDGYVMPPLEEYCLNPTTGVIGYYMEDWGSCIVSFSSSSKSWHNAQCHCMATAPAGFYGRLATFETQYKWDLFYDNLILPGSTYDWWLGLMKTIGGKRKDRLLQAHSSHSKSWVQAH